MLLQMIVVQVLTFLAIIFILKKFLYTETAKEVERLKDLKEESIKIRNEDRRKAEEAEKLYKDKVTQAEDEARRISLRAEDEAQELKKQIVAKAKEEAEQMIKAAFDMKDKIKEEAYLEMKKKIPSAAIQIFKETISSKVCSIIHKELVKEVIGGIKKIDKAKFNVDFDDAQLIYALPLDKDERNQLQEIIFEKWKKKISFQEKEDKDIIAGVSIMLGTLIIDGSLKNRLRQIQDNLDYTI